MSLGTWDLGEIIRNHIYIREIYSSNQKGKCLFSSKDLLHKLTRIYENLGIKQSASQETQVKVKLPDNSNPVFRDYWNETTLRAIGEESFITEFDKLLGYHKKEVVFASSSWMGEFESHSGDEIVISPLIKLNKPSTLTIN
ncbi:hypothetical protein JW865_06570 [Candidatus Bathyarchaeota archaeon]|nr:hypothetical protein [Candidatus Bathyarchaeota archaeon]